MNKLYPTNPAHQFDGATPTPTQGCAHIQLTSDNIITLPNGIQIDGGRQFEHFISGEADARFDVIKLSDGRGIVVDDVASFYYESHAEMERLLIADAAGDNAVPDASIRVDHKPNSMSMGLPIASLGDAVRWLRSVVAERKTGQITGSDFYQLDVHNFRPAMSSTAPTYVTAQMYLDWLLCQELVVCTVSEVYEDDCATTVLDGADYAFTSAELEGYMGTGIAWLSTLENLKAKRHTGASLMFVVPSNDAQADSETLYIVTPKESDKKTVWTVVLHTDTDDARVTYRVDAVYPEQAIALARQRWIAGTYGAFYNFDVGEYPEFYLDDIQSNQPVKVRVNDLSLVEIERDEGTLAVSNLFIATVVYTPAGETTYTSAYSVIVAAKSAGEARTIALANEAEADGEVVIETIERLTSVLAAA